MSPLNIALSVVGILVLTLGLLTRPINRSLVSAPLLSFIAGALIGPHASGWLDPAAWGDSHKLLEEATRLTLGISLMGIALRLPARYPFHHWRPLAVLLLIVMPAMCAISALLAGWLIGLPLLVALLVGAAVCPTDPVVASSIVTGGLAKEALPERFRHMLSAESGINDGLAYPLVFLPILLFTLPSGEVWGEWIVKTWLWEVGGSVVCGALLGMLAGRVLVWAEDRNFIDQPSFLSITVALTLLTLGVGKLIGTDSVLAVFAAGVCFDQCVGGRQRAEDDNVQEAVNQFFTLPVFILFGLMAPWGEWGKLGWAGISLVVAILLLRRLPVILALRPWLKPWRDWPVAFLAGWFGPIGVSAIFYSMTIASQTGNEQAWRIGSLVVFGSLIVHGVTAAPLARWYGRR
jgi:NhaP-type Na+/H+ or K+/H+ antiporter